DIDENRDDEYSKLLQSKKLWPVDPMVEKDWSGRGQHAEFKTHEKKLLDDILNVQDLLGSTSTAVVQSVKCKRILLARKTIRCNRYLTKDKAIEEVAHLSRLKHSHVVQVIGTYTMGTELSILMYPVAEHNLETFIQDLDPRNQSELVWTRKLVALGAFFGCLVHAVEYLHSNMTKHMDLKPKNILVRHIRYSAISSVLEYKVYIADFGISRSYDTLDDTETDGPTMFTRKYAAPEVVDRQKRGLSADIFSLGCVFAEIGATLDYFQRSFDPASSTRFDYETAKIRTTNDLDHLQKLQDILDSNEYGDRSYQANIDAVCEFLGEIRWDHLVSRFVTQITSEIPRMISKDPLNRPSATSLALSRNILLQCCQSGSDPLEAAPLDSTNQE
ncbi:kinase-like protein, partial [Melanomma pulvis-pyrius CBS 109.77]